MKIAKRTLIILCCGKLCFVCFVMTPVLFSKDPESAVADCAARSCVLLFVCDGSSAG